MSDTKNHPTNIKWVDSQFGAIMDEFREFKNAIGGMSKGEKTASAVWKNGKVIIILLDLN